MCSKAEKKKILAKWETLVENNLRNGDEKITIRSIVNVSIKSKLGNENPDQNDIANKTVSSKSKFS